MQRRCASGVLTVSPGASTRSAGSTELGPMSKKSLASLTGLSIEAERSTGDFSTWLVTRIFQFPLHPSETTNHSPVALLRAKNVGCPHPDFPRSPEIIFVSLTRGSKRHAPSNPHLLYCA